MPQFSRKVRYAGAIALLAGFTLATAVGCGPQRRTYEVFVRNEAEGPVTVWMAKEGLPIEFAWMTPAQWAIMQEVRHEERYGTPAIDLAPGQGVRIGPRTGRFNQPSYAVLHIYPAPITLDEMAAVEKRSPMRQIIPLEAGQNTVAVTNADPPRAQRTSPRPPGPAHAAGDPPR